MSEQAKDSESKRAAFRAEMEKHLASLPEETKAKLKSIKDFMTPERQEVFNRYQYFFWDRINSIQDRQITRHLTAHPEQRAEFGRQLRAIRKRMDWTQAHAAEQVGLNTETISRVENGARVDPETLAKIYNAYMVDMRSPEEILIDDDREWFALALDRLITKDYARLDLLRHPSEEESPSSIEGGSGVPAPVLEARIRQLERLVADREALVNTLRDVAKRLTDAIAEHGTPDALEGADPATDTPQTRGGNRKAG